MLLFTYIILFVSVAPLIGRVADGLANVVSTEIIPLFLPQPLYKEIEVNQTDKQECQINRRCAEHAKLVLTFGCVNRSFPGSPGTSVVNTFQSL